MFRQGRRFITAISAIALGVLIVLGILLPDVFWWMLLAAGLIGFGLWLLRCC